MARIGLIAGFGSLPAVFAEAAKSRGDTVIALGLRGITQEDLASRVEKLHWFQLGDFQKAVMVVVAERIKKIVMLGKIKKDLFFRGGEKLDDKMKSMLDKLNDRKDYSILSQVSKVLAPFGIEIMDPTDYLRELVPSKGVLTKREPTKAEWEDINYGKEVARELARFDIGQTVAVKDKTVIAIESVEGTDETIKRAGGLSKIGFSVIKVARPNQDMRFDVPLVGLETVKVVIDARGDCLALEAEKTFLMDREAAVKAADEKGVSIVII